MLTINPPPSRPAKLAQTNQRPKTYYTIQSNKNNAFSMKVKQNDKTCLVGFKNIKNAILLGKMIETYYNQNGEMPDTQNGEPLFLPEPGKGEVLRRLFVQQWNLEDLKLECARNVLDLLSVDNYKNSKTGYNFTGELYKFEVTDADFYRARFEELLPVNNDPDDGPY
jgi:hypothetical protein